MLRMNAMNPAGNRVNINEYQNLMRMSQQKSMNNAQDLQRAAATNRSIGYVCSYIIGNMIC